MVMAEERRKRAIVSETQLDSAATDARQPDAETGEADEVSDYSEDIELGTVEASANGVAKLAAEFKDHLLLEISSQP